MALAAVRVKGRKSKQGVHKGEAYRLAQRRSGPVPHDGGSAERDLNTMYCCSSSDLAAKTSHVTRDSLHMTLGY